MVTTSPPDSRDGIGARVLDILVSCLAWRHHWLCSHAAYGGRAPQVQAWPVSGQRMLRDSVFQPRAPLRHGVSFEQVSVSFSSFDS